MRTAIVLLLLSASLAVHGAVLRKVHLLKGMRGTRVILAMSAEPRVHIFSLGGRSHRLVIDLDDSTAAQGWSQGLETMGPVRDVRIGQHARFLRVVLDLRGPVRVGHFAAPASHHYSNRLILELTPRAAAAPVLTASDKTSKPRPPLHPVARATHPSRQTLRPPHAGSFVVAIDPGHGGIDPGAHGPDGLDEKTVTLAIAKRLARLVDRTPGMRAILTRHGDYYVGLNQRRFIARRAHARIFISIHCNASPDPTVRGTAVYMLSQHGASSVQARLVADRENAADQVGNIDIAHRTRQLASVLVDISQTATLDASADLAKDLLHQMTRISPAWQGRIQRAAFVVLKSPAIPSVLVETDFITNPHEERLLGSAGYQERIAARLLAGIKAYHAHYVPSRRRTRAIVAQRRHIGIAPRAAARS